SSQDPEEEGSQFRRGAYHQIRLCPSAPLPLDGIMQPNTNGGRGRWMLIPGTVRSAWANTPREFGSYSVNGWLVDPVLDPHGFHTQAEIVQPAMTPVLGDALEGFAFPSASVFPSPTLSAGGGTFGPGMPAPDMRAFAIPRHGSRPSPLPNQWPLNLPFPGAVNVSFFDGHGELVKLDRLWQL